jgi:xyloglucan-specific endo-beta-1,4-glucanase
MERTCEDGGFIVQGKYFVYNNLWGGATGSGSQCVWGSALDGSHVAWGTSWNWTGRDDTIKSYAAIVLGWHGGWRVAGTGMPIQLSSIESVHTRWDFDLSHETPGATNVTYDIWLSDDPHHDREDPTGEVMIWLHHTGGIRPIGSRQTTTAINGTEWDLWEGPHPELGWPAYSFVRTANTRSESLDLMAFFERLIPDRLSGSNYLLSVEAGAEVFAGEGRLDTTHYSIDIERR